MRKNVLMEQLYDMASTKDENGLSQFDEAKLKRELEKSMDKNFMRPNKDIFEEGEIRFSTCTRYNPCPICEKCKNKASNLYIACQKCQIPMCVHDYKTMNRLIVRRNFVIKPNMAVKKAIKRISDEYELSKKRMEELH